MPDAFKREGYTFKEDNSAQIVLAPWERIIFFSGTRLFRRALLCRKANRKKRSPPHKMAELYQVYLVVLNKYEPAHDKTNKMACAPSEDSDQPGHRLRLIRVLAVHSVGS